MSGRRCFGSSAGKGQYTIGTLLPVRSLTSAASSNILNSSGFPKLTGLKYSTLISPVIPLTRPAHEKVVKWLVLHEIAFASC
jgi:hypothetical protein